MKKNRKPKLLSYWQVFLRFQSVRKTFADLLIICSPLRPRGTENFLTKKKTNLVFSASLYLGGKFLESKSGRELEGSRSARTKNAAGRCYRLSETSCSQDITKA